MVEECEQKVTIQFLFDKCKICQTNYPEKADMDIVVSAQRL